MKRHWLPNGSMALVPDEVEQKILEMLQIRSEDGWVGEFSRKQYPGAMPNGSRVKKIKSDHGDTHSLGAQATILGSVIPMPWDGLGYFVEWDDTPKHAVFVKAEKIGSA